MNVICMVPSWTETLIECGVNVVGRTRFCLHPADRTKHIAVVGGTKDLHWEKVRELKADLLVVDREENLPWMKDESPIPVHVTHVQSVSDLEMELVRFSQVFPDCAEAFLELSQRWRKQLSISRSWNWSRVPGVIESLNSAGSFAGEHGRQSTSSSLSDHRPEKLVYVIWRDPWMKITKETWIGSVLDLLGAGDFVESTAESFSPETDSKSGPRKYPEFKLDDFDLEKTFFLFSSEPFPFHKKLDELKSLGVRGAVVDGEVYSWFGLRSLMFLESLPSEE